MAPGPITAATLAAGARRRHAGAMIALGHGVIEFPLMLVILAGAGEFFKFEGVKTAIGLAGGAVLLRWDFSCSSLATHRRARTASPTGTTPS